MSKIFKQSGVTLIFFLTILVLGLSAFLLSKVYNRTDWMLEEQAQTAKVLRQAKEALIGFAATYEKTHPGQPLGYLPCPDYDGDGSAEGACSCSGYSVVGRLPWRTLGLPPLRDGSGECLWYAVSGNYKDNPKSKIDAVYSNPNCSTTLSPVRTLTSDSDGLLRVKNIQDEFIADDVIAIVFAPGKKLGNQKRGIENGTITECGSKDAGVKDPVDSINHVENYLDRYNSDDVIGNDSGVDVNNATSNGPLVFVPSKSGKSGFFVVDNDPTESSTLPIFIDAPLTYGTYDDGGIEKADTGKVIFNDVLMLITPKDYEPIYKRMDFWIAYRVTACIYEYGKVAKEYYFDKYKDIIGDAENPEPDTYRGYDNSDDPEHQPKKWIDTYVKLRVISWHAYFNKRHYQENPNLPIPEPEQKDIDFIKDLALKEAIVFDTQYPWAAPVGNDLDYKDENNQRFGRIPQDLSNTNATNPEIEDDWKAILYEEEESKESCFDETAGLGDYKWGWWKEWKEMVFYAIDDDYRPFHTNYIWVKAIRTKQLSGKWATWLGWLAPNYNHIPDIYDFEKFKKIAEDSIIDEIGPKEVQQIKNDTSAKIDDEEEASPPFIFETKGSVTNVLELGNNYPDKEFEEAAFIVLVAGRRLVLNENSSDPDYPEYSQSRATTADKQLIKNYLEGKAKPVDPVDEDNPITDDLDDPIPYVANLRSIKEGGNLPYDKIKDEYVIPAGDERFIRKPIIFNYFNDVVCMDEESDCEIPKE